MHCEDNGKLRTPLNEVCITTDIGCVPIVNGQPQCSPMPDELPIAYDKTTSTLWLFSCESRTWVAMSKFSMDQLQELNLDNINNICDLLNIGVYYNPGTGNIQGTVTLSEFTTKLLECLKLDTNVLAITQGENNTISISVEGLDGLPPFYIKGDNISFTGTGTQTDPLVVHGADPICKWPVASQSAVDTATTKHLGACLDGQPSRVPYPPKPCEYPSFSKAQVDAAEEKRLIACVDGESVKVPWIEMPCEYERVTEESVAAASSKDIIACVDGKNVKIPIPQGFFADSPCDYPRATQGQVTSASEKDVIVCLDGKDYKIPIPSAFFDPEFLCIPEVLEMPTDPPVQGTGPIRAGCNGEIYLWVCEQNKWIRYETSFKHDLVEWSDEIKQKLDNPCEDIKIHAWYNTGITKDCVEDVQISPSSLVDVFQDCGLGCCQVGCITPDLQNAGAWCIYADVNGLSSLGRVVYSGRDGRIVEGSATITGSTPSAYLHMKIKNNFSKPSLLIADLYVSFNRSYQKGVGKNIFCLTENFNADMIGVEIPDAYSNYGIIHDTGEPVYAAQPGDPRGNSSNAKGHVNYTRLLQPNEEITLYGFSWVLLYATGYQYFHTGLTGRFKLFNYVLDDCSVIDESIYPEDDNNQNP